jgi:nicotinamide riboside kinase
VTAILKHDWSERKNTTEQRGRYIFIITGPESAGKSSLTEELAKYFNGIAVKEYARDYVENLNRNYTFEDVEAIAAHQVEEYHSVTEITDRNRPVFFDTFLFITKVWFEEVFYCCPLWLHRAIKKCRIDLALLCFPDLPWEPDGVRENPHRRYYLFGRYLHELKYYGVPYCVVRGFNHVRMENAIKCIDRKRR